MDGILSGMLLQHFLGWEVVGFSNCAGKPEDELWLKDNNINLAECVFIDLPVAIDDIAVIDQHFVTFDTKETENPKKFNPNILRKRVFLDEQGFCQYRAKYPFGTAHFVLAVLERLNIIPSDYVFSIEKDLGGFDLADLIFRADRCIGNMCAYTPNCTDWADWLIKVGGKNTANIFNLAKTEHDKRLQTERAVEVFLRGLGCSGADGECSNLFRERNYPVISRYFESLGKMLELPPLPIFRFETYGNLTGERIEITPHNLQKLKLYVKQPGVFSFAFVTMKVLSVTYLKNTVGD